METISATTAIQCIQIPCNVLGNLNITCDTVNMKIVLWSKYELLIFNPIVKDTIAWKIEFEIEQVLVNGDCLLCLDCSGIINVCTSESSSIYDKQNIKCLCACEINNIQHVVSLQFEQDRSKLLLNNFDMNFDSKSEFKIRIPNEDWKEPEPGKAIISACHIKPEQLKKLRDILYVGKSDSNYLLVIVTLDRRNVYAILIPITPLVQSSNVSGQDRSPNLGVKLHSNHTEIIDIKITMRDDICILLGLAAGNIVKLPLSLRNKKPGVCHLNTAISKFAVIGNTIIYTDGLTMWKNNNLFSQSDCAYEQFVVRNIRDFCLIKKQVYCITYTNLIYSFDIGHRASYVKPPEADNSCDVEVVTNSDYLQKTMRSIEKNKELVDKINKESEYLMAVSLSKRQDIMDELIHTNVSVYDDFRDITQKYNDLVLTDNLDDYYDSQSYYFLVQISVAKIQHKLNKLLSDVLGDIKLHITLRAQETLKTTSIQIKEQLSKKNLVISLKKQNRNIRRVKMYIKIITNIPGKFDENQRIWIILYRKLIVLNAENFINMKICANGTSLKEEEIPLDLLICRIANHLYGKQYQYNTSESQRFEWSFYLKLPSNPSLHIGSILELVHNVETYRTEVFRKYMTKFSKDRNWLELQIGNERVNLNIEDDKLKVSCPDVIIALDIRNFFSDIIYASFKGKPALFNNNLTGTIENWKRDVETVRRRKGIEFARLFIELLRDIYCTIPI